MNVNLDKVADVVYMEVQESKVSRTVKVDDLILVDLDKDENVVGIEILNASKKLQESISKSVTTGIPITITEATPTCA